MSKDTVFNLRLSAQDKELLMQLAARDGRSASGLIRHLVRREALRVGTDQVPVRTSQDERPTETYDEMKTRETGKHDATVRVGTWRYIHLSRRVRILAAIRDFREWQHISPSYMDIAALVGLHSKSSVAGHLEALEAEGLITKPKQRLARSVLLTPLGELYLREQIASLQQANTG